LECRFIFHFSVVIAALCPLGSEPNCHFGQPLDLRILGGQANRHVDRDTWGENRRVQPCLTLPATIRGGPETVLDCQRTIIIDCHLLHRPSPFTPWDDSQKENGRQYDDRPIGPARSKVTHGDLQESVTL